MIGLHIIARVGQRGAFAPVSVGWSSSRVTAGDWYGLSPMACACFNRTISQIYAWSAAKPEPAKAAALQRLRSRRLWRACRMEKFLLEIRRLAERNTNQRTRRRSQAEGSAGSESRRVFSFGAPYRQARFRLRQNAPRTRSATGKGSRPSPHCASRSLIWPAAKGAYRSRGESCGRKAASISLIFRLQTPARVASDEPHQRSSQGVLYAFTVSGVRGRAAA